MKRLVIIYDKYKYLIIIILSIVFLCCFVLLAGPSSNVEDTKMEIIETEKVMDEASTSLIKINIKGAVKNPGVYEISDDSRVEDAVIAAGGLLGEADTSIINLSKKLSDENVVIIYTRDEVRKIKQGNVVIQYIEKECNCPEYENSACIDPDILINNNQNEDDSSVNKVSLNKASLEELQTLSGIGEAKAKLIIEYRETKGLFKSIEEIKNIKGIGDAIFNKIKDHITT